MASSKYWNGNIKEIQDDEQAWWHCDRRDLWLFDKLLLSEFLNYNCGPAGSAVPYAGYYVVRPITNIRGMGLGSSIQYLDTYDFHSVPPGYFWCEKFSGEHLSVDYDRDLNPILSVKGTMSNKQKNLHQWGKWGRVNYSLPFPEEIVLHGEYSRVNVEFIGGKPIEVHLRGNPDFPDNCEHSEIIPVWDNFTYDHEELVQQGYEFHVSEDDADGLLPSKRLGFYKR